MEDDMTAAEADDQRLVEIDTLAAIFPELEIDDNDRFSVSLEVPVHPAKTVTVAFLGTGATPHSTAPRPANSLTQTPDETQAMGSLVLASHEVSYLPSVQLRICLPDGYPATNPPKFRLSTSPPWLPGELLKQLEDDGRRLWEELGRDLVVFHYVDHIQQSADKVFGLLDSSGSLGIDAEHRISILDADAKAKHAAFCNETFYCGVCLEFKKGAVCHRMHNCGHVFCVQCLQDFYNNAIREGDLATVRCLEPSCAKKRETAMSASAKGRNFRPIVVSPGELLQIPVDESMVRRYVELKYKMELESDKTTVYCPRTWCNGAARSKKHKKPQGLVLYESDGETSGTEEGLSGSAAGGSAGPTAEGGSHGDGGRATGEDEQKKKDSDESSQSGLAICEDCRFAFCARCKQSWHGEFVYCIPRQPNGEITQEDKASLAYLAHYTTPCPTCAAPAQKIRGCNHMICSRCCTHFCYLCAAWLDPRNPYRHFGMSPSGKMTSCYNRLWDMENGDERGIDIAGLVQEQPVGGHGNNNINANDDDDWGWMIHHDQDGNVPGADGGENEHGRRPEQIEDEHAADHAQQQPVVAREGPLVIRIAVDPPPRAAQRDHEHRGGRGMVEGGRGGAGGGGRRLGRGRGRGRGREL